MRRLTAALLLVVVVMGSSFDTCCARGGGRSSKEGGRGGRGRDSAGLQQHSHGGGVTDFREKPSLIPVQTSQRWGVFGVKQFGATGNGISDDTKAFQAAWAAACNEEGSTVLVPSGNEFLVGLIIFSGSHCQPNIVFQPGLLQWLKFTKLRRITVRGRGVIDGRGASWWGELPHGMNCSRVKPTALRFYGSDGITVAGITIRNSAQCPLKFDSCTAVERPHHGIHLQNSKNVSIHHVVLGCGDDCVSIQTGCSDVEIRSVACGPGYGISIGGLGGGNAMACVSDITVQDVTLRERPPASGGSGRVENIKFSNIWVTEVKIPVVIEYYCDKGCAACRNQSSAVALAGISYEGVRGTYTASPLHLPCSDSAPCAGIRLSNEHLDPANGQLTSPVVPLVGCLQSGESTTHPAPASC
ncbi:unnamed protein product [Spirodela intermedia]|uniref:Uncharacterized protein n=1 Tax=Spirodela intermedia TaxID=51605 RepID=A0A7I8ITB5_SPIIN|nr:unnamed protein product [Spirodela intermedia]CAA6661213.1 unnamed protein product [Spirodela intermedia]